MRISLSTPATRIGMTLAGSAAALLAFGGVAAAQPPAVPLDPGGIISTIAEPVTPALYNAAQDNLVKGNYDVGLASLDALALAAPDNVDVASLQAFYRNASGDSAGRDEALVRLGSLDSDKHAIVERALGIIATSAESTIDFAPVMDGPRTAVVALGFGLNGDGSMQETLIGRLEAALAAANASPESPVLVTGGNPRSGVAEAQAMREWLLDKGIADERIHVEDTANSTVQNALASQPILESLGAQNIVIATSPDHIRRSISNFTIAGSTVIGAAATAPASPPDVPTYGPDSRLGLTVDATKVVGIPRTY